MSRLSLPAVLLLACFLAPWASAAGPEQPRYSLIAAPDRGAVPAWAWPGRMRYARCDGGPVEVCKAFMSGWDQIRRPDAILPCANYYNDSTIDMVRQSHINWIWVTWSVGFSHDSEAVQRRIVAPFIAKCRAEGIRVTAYVSLTNMFIDDMTQHVPAAKDWMQLELNGEPRPYGAAKYDGKPTRIIACLNQPGWLEYSKQRIASAIEAGVDAIFYDNCIQGCKCSLCRKKFARYTDALYGQPLAVPGAKTDDASRNVQGREVLTRDQAADLAGRAWARFCCQSLSAAMAHHRRYADSLRPGILIYANTHQQPHMNDHCNAIFSEDGTEPGRRGDEFLSNLGLFKFYYAEGDGRKPIRIEYGRRIHGDRMENPMPPRNQTLAVYEGAACQGAQQTFFEMGWTTKLARGDQDARDSLAALTAANQWLASHEALFAEVEPIAKTAVVLPAWESVAPLALAGKNFLLLQPKHLTPLQLAQFDLVILSNVRSLSDEQVRAVLGYVDRGGRLIATQETSCHDGLLRTRQVPGLAPLWGELAAGKERTENKFGKGICVHYRQAPQTAELLADWGKLEPQPLASIQSPSPGVCLNLARTWDGQHTLLYLLNYGDRPAAGCRATLNLPSPARSLRLHIPGSQASQLSPNSAGEGLSMDIPEFDSLAVLEIW